MINDNNKTFNYTKECIKKKSFWLKFLVKTFQSGLSLILFVTIKKKNL